MFSFVENLFFRVSLRILYKVRIQLSIWKYEYQIVLEWVGNFWFFLFVACFVVFIHLFWFKLVLLFKQKQRKLHIFFFTVCTVTKLLLLKSHYSVVIHSWKCTSISEVYLLCMFGFYFILFGFALCFELKLRDWVEKQKYNRNNLKEKITEKNEFILWSLATSTVPFDLLIVLFVTLFWWRVHINFECPFTSSTSIIWTRGAVTITGVLIFQLLPFSRS